MQRRVALSLLLPQPSQVGSRAELEEPGTLVPGDGESLVETALRFGLVTLAAREEELPSDTPKRRFGTAVVRAFDVVE